jgi:hypothetical protein
MTTELKFYAEFVKRGFGLKRPKTKDQRPKIVFACCFCICFKMNCLLTHKTTICFEIAKSFQKF